MYKSYLKHLLFFCLLLALPIGGNWLFLCNCGELLSVEEIVKKQLNSQKNCIVGLATRNQGYYYKKALYDEARPQVLVLGSSRVMQIRESFFTKSMVNAGGAMSSINEGLSFLQETLNDSAPEIAIIGLDYWWFNQNALEPSTLVKPPLKLSHSISVRSYLLPYKWLWEKKITPTQYLSTLKSFGKFSASLENGIGVDGILFQNGFAKDGSYVYAKTISGNEPNFDDRFLLSMNNISQNGSRFEYGASVNAVHFANFIRLLKLLEQKKVKYFVFIAPLAPQVANKMDEYQEQYRFIADLRVQLSGAGVAFSDFHHPDSLGASDCEFIDGIHGGDLVYARILKNMASKHPELGAYTHQEYLNKVTHYYRDIAMIPQGNSAQAEVDFLHLGCDKSTQYAQLPLELYS